MKKRINGRVYDSHKARLVGVHAGDSISTALFRTKSGAFFVVKYAGDDPRDPELGAIEPVGDDEAQALYTKMGFEASMEGVFDGGRVVRTTVELDVDVRNRLQYLTRYNLDGTPRPKRVGMGDVVTELLMRADAQG